MVDRLPLAPPPPPPPLLPSHGVSEPSLMPLPPTPPCFSLPSVNTNVHSVKKGIVQERTSTTVEQVRKAYRWFIQDQGLTEEQSSDYIFIARYHPVKPVIQNGPLCGMVALAMVTQLAGREDVATEAILEEARQQGYSLQGELFSAAYMQKLASKFLCWDVSEVTWNSSQEACRVFIKALLQQCLILLPYDADRNHGPCQAKGHKAHWALLAGFFTAVKKEAVKTHQLSNHLTQDEEIKGLCYWSHSEGGAMEAECMDAIVENSLRFQVMMHQGKSKHCGVWTLEAILDSNANLVEAGPERDSHDYLLPPGGVEAGLCRKAVLVWPPPR